MFDIFIRRPRLAIVISLVITLAGLIAIAVIPVAQYPDIAPPTVRVTASYAGADARTVEESIAQPLENAINGVPGMRYMKSSSVNDGSYTLNVSFDIATNPDIATVNVQNRARLAEAKLPQDVRTTGLTIAKVSTDLLQVFMFHSSDDSHDQLFLSNFVTLNVLDELKRVPGVGDASIFGARDYSMRIWIDPQKLANFGLSTGDVISAIQTQNVQAAAGRIGAAPLSDDQRLQLTITTKGRLSTAEEFGAIVVRSAADGSFVRLRDVARVELEAASFDSIARFTGRSVAPVGIYLSPGSNAVAVATAVTKRLEELKSRFPKGVGYSYIYNTAAFVSAMMEKVVMTLLEAFALVAGHPAIIAVGVLVLPEVIVGITGVGYGLHIDSPREDAPLGAVIGVAGQYGRPGFLAAFDVDSGRRVWQFDTIAAQGWEGQFRETTPDGVPLNRDTATERARAPQYAEAWRNGGGSAWTTPAIDPELGLLYFGTGNPSPQMDDISRPGDNLYSVSLVALEADTGKLRWHYQQVPHDVWGYDLASPPVLFDYKREGKSIPAVGQASKTGWFYVHDRRSGELLRKSEAFVPQSNLFVPATREGTRVHPGVAGGVNWSPAAVDEATQTAYVAAMHMPIRYTLHEKPAQDGKPAIRYTVSEPIEEARWGLLSAIDLASGKLRWQHQTPEPLIGGVLATAGGLLFTGEGNGRFDAFDIRNGQLLWQYQADAGVNAPPITYAIAGVQYVAVNAGWGGGIAHGPAARDYQMRLSRSARLLVYRLDGDAELPPLPEENWQTTRVNQPPPSTGTPAQIARGETLYAQICSGCHGAGARGGIKDLRMMSAETHAEFNAIVLEGVREERGMVSFADRLSPADADAIHAYLVHRANADWNGSDVR